MQAPGRTATMKSTKRKTQGEKAMKVLYVATVVKTHIMEFHIPFLKMFKEKGWETAVAARNDYENPEDCKIPYCDTYFDLPFERNPFKPDNVKAYKRLKEIIETGDYDIIHCHTPVGAALTRLAARKARKRGTKVFYTAHGFHFYKGAPLINWLVYFPAEWLCSFWTDTLITINKEDYERAKRHLHAKQVAYVPGVGIDFRRFAETGLDRAAKRKELGIPENATVLLSVGELTENKNHAVIIRALAERKNKETHYVIAGRGLLKETLSALAISLGVEKQVHLLGYRQDVAELYQAADIFASLREGLPVAVMEAMAAGLPIVAPKIRGVTDLLTNSENVLVQNGKNVDEFITAIDSIVEIKKKHINFGQENVEHIRQYDVVNIQRKMCRIYGIE